MFYSVIHNPIVSDTMQKPNYAMNKNHYLLYCPLELDLLLNFAERIHDLENRLKNDEYEFQRKDKIISELEAQLEAAKNSDCSRAQIEEISTQLLKINATFFCFRRINLQF